LAPIAAWNKYLEMTFNRTFPQLTAGSHHGNVMENPFLEVRIRFMLKSNLRVFAFVFSVSSLLLAPCVMDAQTPAAQVICNGDSLTFGSHASKGEGTATGTTYPGVLAMRLGEGWKVTNVGLPGWPTEGISNHAKDHVDPLYDPKLKENVLIIMGGTNNMGIYHQDGAQAYAHVEEYCRARKAAHPWKILIVTLPMAAYPSYAKDFDAKATTYDTLVRRNWRRFADGVVDLQADPRFGAPGAEFDSRYFDAKDHTHLTDAGYQLVGEAAAKAVTKIIGRPTREAQQP
jgi:lysophospholipase L1-like esterase